MSPAAGSTTSCRSRRPPPRCKCCSTRRIGVGLADQITPERLDLDEDDPTRPILLACSDNGPQMTSNATRGFFAALAIAHGLGRSHTPADQAWIESLFGHVKGEWPHFEQITDPGVLDRIRGINNGTRLHAGIGYVTPDDEHTGRGEQIPQAKHSHELVHFSSQLRG